MIKYRMTVGWREKLNTLEFFMHFLGDALLQRSDKEIRSVMKMSLTMFSEQPNALLQHFCNQRKIFCNIRLVYQLKFFWFMEMLNTVD